MRGLVVLGVVLFVLFVASGLSSATNKGTTETPSEVKISCKANKGTYVEFMATVPSRGVVFEGVCQQAYVPANWKLLCYSDMEKEEVEARFFVGGKERHTLVRCE